MIRGYGSLLCSTLILAAVACGGRATAPLSPSAPSTPAKSSFSGRVITTRTMIPISDATVTIVTGTDAGKSTKTDASGNFTFTGLEQASIFVEVSAPEFFTTHAPVMPNQTQTFFLVPLGPVIVLTGRVTSANTSTPIAGARVNINGRYATTTDSSGIYNLTGHLDIGDSSNVWVFLDGYELFTRFIRGISSQSFQLRPVQRITGGDSWSVTVQPNDSLCNNNLQEPGFSVPGTGFLCRTVRVIAPSDGALKLEAVSTQDGTHPPLEVEVLNPCCFERMENPTSINVRTGTEVLVNIEIPERSTASQSFILTTSMSQ
jgi:carboxypeptidase family protein